MELIKIILLINRKKKRKENLMSLEFNINKKKNKKINEIYYLFVIIFFMFLNEIIFKIMYY